MTFKIDTGAEVTAISQADWNSLPQAPPIEKCSKILSGPDNTPLEVMGEATVEVKSKHRESLQKIYVVRGLTANLLGLPAIEALDLVRRVHSIQNKDILSGYPQAWADSTKNIPSN